MAKIVFVALVAALCLFSSVKADNCAICEEVVGTIESWVASNYTETEIEGALQLVCSYVPQFESVVR